MMGRAVRRVVVLTGAGVSAESGIRTFRAADGLWEDHRVEDVATPEAFVRDPSLVQRFYNARRRQLVGGDGALAVTPNGAHEALTRFESRLTEAGGEFFLITQNVDDLHERAQTKNVRHMHGELLKVRCVRTGKIFPWTTDCGTDTACSCCDRRGTLRPHIVWFGEIPLYMDEIHHELSQADLFVSIGTSGNVYPAAGFFQIAKMHGAWTVELNLEPSQNAAVFDEGFYGLASEVVPRYFETLELGTEVSSS